MDLLALQKKDDQTEYKPFNEINDIQNAFHTLDSDLRFTYISEQAGKLFTYTRDEMLGRTLVELYPEIEDTRLYIEYKRVLKACTPVNFEIKGIEKGSWFEVYAFPAFGGIAVFFRDITHLKKLQEEATELALIINSSSDAISGTTTDGIITTWNKAAEQLYGFTKEEAIGNHISIIFPKGNNNEVQKIFERLSRGEIIETETKRRRKDGRKIHVSTSLFPVKDEDGNIVKYSGITRDITAQKELQEAIKRERERLFLLLNEFPGIVTVQDNNHQIIFANKNFRNVFGDYENKTCYELTRGRSIPCDNCETYRNFPPAEPMCYEISCINGKAIEMHEQPFFDIDGTPLTVKIGLDITSRKLAEQELTKYERLNVVGETAAGIAHEIRNPMTTVRGFLQLLGDKREFEEYRDYYDLMISELDRANKIITEFLSLAKNAHVDLEEINLNQIIKAIYPLLLAEAMSTDKTLRLNLNELPDLYLNQNEIRQLIMNLAKNGLEAMPSGKNLTISTFAKNDKVILEIQDEGAGISKEVLDKLGTPFVTTKAAGTGLGLPVSYSIAARHKAKIDVKTGKQGTKFIVNFNQRVIPKG